MRCFFLPGFNIMTLKTVNYLETHMTCRLARSSLDDDLDTYPYVLLRRTFTVWLPKKNHLGDFVY